MEKVALAVAATLVLSGCGTIRDRVYDRRTHGEFACDDHPERKGCGNDGDVEKSGLVPK
jgi:uncharacterized protein YceK